MQFNVPIFKARTKLPLNTKDVPKEVLEEATKRGLMVLANAGMARIALEPENERIAAALAMAANNIANIKKGNVRFRGW